MKPVFTPIEGRTDGGGVVTLTATTAEEMFDLIQRCDLPKEVYPHGIAARLVDPTPLVHQLYMGFGDNVAWFQESGAAAKEFTQPYYKELRKRTGFEGAGFLPDIPAEAFEPLVTQFSPCHWFTRLWVDDGHLCFDSLLTSRDFGKKTAAEWAVLRAEEAANSMLGHRPLCPEFLDAGGGTYRRNPKYPSIMDARPALDNQAFFGAIIDWWLLHHATPQQRALVQMSHDINSANHRGVSDLHGICNFTSHLRVAWDREDVKGGKHLYTWQEFQALGNK